MFFLVLLLFLAGMALFAVAFTLTSFQAVVFVAGILLICLSMAIPMHMKAR